MAKPSVKQSVKRFVGLVRKGGLSKSKFLSAEGGLKRLSTRSLQAAAGQAPLPSTNLAIKSELESRAVSQTYDNQGHSPIKKSFKVR
jgi:hypothetical protein